MEVMEKYSSLYFYWRKIIITCYVDIITMLRKKIEWK